MFIHLNYFNGCLFGRPGLRGYFFGVSFFFCTVIMCRVSPFGNETSSAWRSLPPNKAIAGFASTNSSSLFAAFKAKK